MKMTLYASSPIHESREKARNIPPRGLREEDVFDISVHYSPEPWYSSRTNTNIPREFRFEVMGKKYKRWTGTSSISGERTYIDRFSPERIVPYGDISSDIIRRNKGTSLLRAIRQAIIAHIRETTGITNADCTRIIRKTVDIDEWHKDEE